ncbi:MAG: hypothetical protein Q7U57_17360 [Methylovulum sp.]|nr:hypothetical protein [Methylovulum sp.]
MEGYKGRENGIHIVQVPEETYGIVMEIFEPMARRINQLPSKVLNI